MSCPGYRQLQADRRQMRLPAPPLARACVIFALRDPFRRGVSEMITGLLETLSHQVEARQDVSDGDVLQALAMTLAVRARMVDADADSTLALVNELVEAAYRAAQEAPAYEAARA